MARRLTIAAKRRRAEERTATRAALVGLAMLGACAWLWAQLDAVPYAGPGLDPRVVLLSGLTLCGLLGTMAGTLALIQLGARR